MSINEKMNEYMRQINAEYEKCVFEMAENHGIPAMKFLDYMKKGKCMRTETMYNKKDGTGVVKKEKYVVNGVDIGTVVTEQTYPTIKEKSREQRTYATLKISIE